MSIAVSVKDLVIRRGSHIAVDGLSFEAHRGQVTALLGPNGAGKTTTVETCEGFHSPRSGSIEILGHSPTKDHKYLAPRVGVMLQQGGVDSGVKPIPALRQMATLYENPLDVQTLATTLGLDPITANYRRMSGGEQQRLKFAISILGRPEVLFLDEPTSGMDLDARNKVWQLISELRNSGVCVVMTTHNMEDVERLADKIVLINQGQLVAQGSPTYFTQSDAGGIRFNAPIGTDFSELADQFGTSASIEETTPGSFHIAHQGDLQALASLSTWSIQRGISLSNVSTDHERLEDVIARLSSNVSTTSKGNQQRGDAK